jgi:hypothetical protein
MEALSLLEIVQHCLILARGGMFSSDEAKIVISRPGRRTEVEFGRYTDGCIRPSIRSITDMEHEGDILKSCLRSHSL